MAKYVTLIRHAQSAANAGHATSNHATIPLTELGMQQAAMLSEKIQDKPDLIIVSPYDRAMDTAKPLIKIFPDVPVETWEVIHEMNNLSPKKCENMTALERFPMVEAKWQMTASRCLDGFIS